MLRPDVSDFMSIVCFKAVIVGVEDTLGKDGAAVVFTRAGRVRGQTLASDLGISGSHMAPEELAANLNAALGKDGTRLCLVVRARLEEGGTVVVDTAETVCSAGEPQGSDRLCTFTLGAVWGALEAVSGKSYLGRHTDSVLRGGQFDTFVFTPL